MFSLMLSSEDFPAPMETPQPEVVGAAHPPLIGTPVSRSIFPPSQASHSLPQPLPPPPPSPPPPPPSTHVPPVPLAPDQSGISPTAPGLPPSSSLVAPKPENPLKRGDDDVQFVSEKPVKRRKLESPAPPNRSNDQPQLMSTPQTGPAPAHVGSGLSQGKDEGSSPPVCESTQTPNAVPGHTSKPAGPEATAGATSLPSLENYVFATDNPRGPASCCKDSPQLSPKQISSTEPSNHLQGVKSQPEVPFSRKSQEPQGEEGGAGVIGADPRPKDPENEAAPPLGQSNQMQQPGGDAEPTNAVTTQRMPPVSRNAALATTGSAQRHETPNTEVSSKDELVVNDTSSQHRSTSREVSYNQQPHGTTAPSTTLPPGSQPGSLACNSAPTPPQHPPVGGPMLAPDASLSSQPIPTNGNPWSHSDATQPDMLKAEENGPPPSVPRTACQQPMGPPAQAGSQVLHRSPTQFQAQPSAPFPTWQQNHVHPQAQAQAQAHAQAQHRSGLHPPGSGPSKAHCRICVARQQQAALQRAAALNGNGNPPLPQGTSPSHGQAQTPNGPSYNVVFVPTPAQGANGSNGAQFNPQTNQLNANTGTMGIASHPYMVRNPQQGTMVGSAHPMQNSRAPQPSMVGQQAQTRSEQRVSHSQNPAPRKFAHQEPSPGKHIIVDIADTAMEAFPFNKVAQRHNVPVDKIRNIFEAVVAIPFLRVPADKRRAGKIGQERVRNYINTKKEVEKARAAEGRDGCQVTVYDMAAAMGPAEQLPKAPNGSAPGFRGPW